MQKIRQMEQELTRLTEANLLRRLQSMEPISPAKVRKGEREYLLFASNNYLGLTHHPEVQAAAKAAVKYGTGSGGARLTSGNHLTYEKLERTLAQFKQAEAALVFNTGYMANVGIISALADREDVIFSDALNHASIIDGCRLAKAHTVVFRHSDMTHLEELLQQTPCKGQRFIITDGVFSMDGDIAKLREIVEIGEQYDCLIMVDDAHATGVIGAGGRGTAAYCGVKGRVQIEVGTLSKSLAAEGGFVAGSQLLISYLMNQARSFIFSTALSPQTVAAAQAALDVLISQPQLVAELGRKTALFKEALLAAGVPVMASDTPILPILVGDAAKTVALAADLETEGLLVSAIRPPTVAPGSSRLRLTVTAAHEEAELIQAAQIIGKVFHKIGLV